jgi:hypothetical protein
MRRPGATAGQSICPNRSHPQQAKHLDKQCSHIRSESTCAAQSREEIWGHTPAPSRLAAARPPQRRESGPASHPNTGPGAEGGGGWPMHATAQPWHAEGRPSPTEALRCLHACSSSAQTKDCKRCKRNSGSGPISCRMVLTPATTDLTWTPETEPALMRASLPARIGQEKPHESQTPQPRADHPQVAHR